MASGLLITAPRVVPATSGPAVLEPGYVLIADGRVAEAAGGPPPRDPDLALGSGCLVPGLIDLQVNGFFGVDLAEVDAAGWARVARRLPETGTTAFLPTLVTAPVGDLAGALRSAAAIASDPPAGARILGVHMEGPFLSPNRAGAHRREWIVPPSPAAVADLLAAGAGVLRVVTLAPEVGGGLALVAALVAAGVVVSVGHSDAAAWQVAAAADAGARMVTHLFNAQRPLHHREPGVVGQALADPRLTCGLIADPSHVAAAVCAIAFAAAPGRICLVTDASAAAGMPPGRYRLGREPVEVRPGEDQAPRLADGTLAGSVLRMDRALANVVAAGVGLAEAVAAATRIPADLIGRPDLGRLTPGAAADLAWLGDDLRTRAAWVAGERLYPLPTAPGAPCAARPGPAGGSPADPR
ncbi:MAG TPA: N-acetylglucosamine-6-phosphate deacetylase [Streptosporangiaceae bacterium]|nr:N-acetylglucosamine-6-phosphate deacetylase [Streptosporangiaceae bacterium]